MICIGKTKQVKKVYCQSLIREVFTTSRVYVKPDVGIRATTNQAPLLSSSCCELMSTFLNKTGIQPGNCTLTHSGHKYNPIEPSDCARWPLSQMTRCGHKPNEPSDCHRPRCQQRSLVYKVQRNPFLVWHARKM